MSLTPNDKPFAFKDFQRLSQGATAYSKNLDKLSFRQQPTIDHDWAFRRVELAAKLFQDT